LYAADPGIAEQLLRTRLPPFDAKLQRFHCHIEPDFVPKLKAIGNCFFRVKDSDRHDPYNVGFNPHRQGSLRKPENPQWRMIQARTLGPSRKGHIDRMWDLGCDLMEMQCRYKADNGFLHTYGYSDEVGVFYLFQVGEPIDPSAELYEPADVS
jgi:hypothetical protein